MASFIPTDDDDDDDDDDNINNLENKTIFFILFITCQYKFQVSSSSFKFIIVILHCLQRGHNLI